MTSTRRTDGMNEDLQEEKQSPAALSQLGEAMRQSGIYGEAVRNFTRVIELKRSLQADDTWALAHRGAARLGMLLVDDAIEDLSEALKKRPFYAWAQAQLGEAYRLQALRCLLAGESRDWTVMWEAIEKSEQAYARSLEQQAMSAWAYAHRGATCALAFWISKDNQYLERGQEYFRTACKINSSYSWAYAFHAFLVSLKGREFDSEVYQLLGMAQLYDINHRLVILRCISELFSYNGQDSESARAGWAALQADPEDFTARYFVAKSLMSNGDPNALSFIEATRFVLNAVQSRVNLFLGGLEAIQGNVAQAEEALTQLKKNADMETLIILEYDRAWDSMRKNPTYLDIFNHIRQPKPQKLQKETHDETPGA